MVPPEFTVKEPVMFRLIYLSATHGEAVSVFAEWVMLPMPPVPETVMVFPLVLMSTWVVPLKDRVPVDEVPLPIVQAWVEKVMLVPPVLVRVTIAAVLMATAL